MESKLSSNNLFAYATSELSQDAFICWLLSFAMKENWDKDLKLRECALEFINKFYQMKVTDRVTVIKKQYKNIDILVEIDSTKIIIEDKTFTNTHNDQINTYKNTLIKEGISSKDILCVYYKIEEQDHPEKGVDFEFTRDKLLMVFRKYKGIIKNSIFKDYVEYLEWIDRDVESYKYKPITEWLGSRAYIGFFKHLLNDVITVRKWYGWNYINNPNGGFWGLWWGLFDNDQLNSMGLMEKYIDELYLQIENDCITVKLSLDKTTDYDMNIVKEMRWQIFDYFKKEIGEEFKKRAFKNGRAMTVGYIIYNEINYNDKIKLMQNTMINILNGKFNFMIK